jgi:hypothetical protein
MISTDCVNETVIFAFIFLQVPCNTSGGVLRTTEADLNTDGVVIAGTTMLSVVGIGVVVVQLRIQRKTNGIFCLLGVRDSHESKQVGVAMTKTPSEFLAPNSRSESLAIDPLVQLVEVGLRNFALQLADLDVHPDLSISIRTVEDGLGKASACTEARRANCS